MTDRILEAYDAEIAEAEAKIARLRAMREQHAKAFGLDTRRAIASSAPVVRVRAGDAPMAARRAKSPETLAILQEVRAIIEAAERPMGATELYRELTARGITVPGKVPANNLSAMLSNCSDFRSNGRGHGWSPSGTNVDTEPTRPGLFPVHAPLAAE